MVLHTSLFNTLHYKVRIKGKVESSREKSSSLPYASVFLLVKREPSVALDYSRQLYYFNYIYIDIYVCVCIYIYIYIQISFNIIDIFCLHIFLFIRSYCRIAIRQELMDVFSIIVYIPRTFYLTLGHHQGRIYYKSDVTFVFALLLCKSVFTVGMYSVYF